MDGAACHRGRAGCDRLAGESGPETGLRAGGHRNADEAGAAGGDPAAAVDPAALYAALAPALRRLAAGMGLSAADTEDALHDACVPLLENRGKFASAADARRWLVRVFVNRCVLHHRHAARRPKTAGLPSGADPVAGQAGDADAAETADIRARVRAGLDELSPEDLALLVMRYFLDLDASAIGDLLGLPAATVRGRLRRARLELAEHLIRRGLGPETGLTHG